jgi:hypothetical protein
MGISQGSIVTNTKHINDLANQIRYTTNCNTLRKIVQEHLQSVLDIVQAKIKEEADTLSNYIPILDLPSPDPISIVKWIGKLVTGTAFTQLMAMIKMTIQMVQLLKAVENLASAIAAAAANIEACVIQIEKDTLATLKTNLKIAEKQALLSFKQKFNASKLGIDIAIVRGEIAQLKGQIKAVKAVSYEAKQTLTNLKNDIQVISGAINGKINKNLGQISTVQTQISTISGGQVPALFDTSSGDALVNSANQHMSTYANNVTSFAYKPTITGSLSANTANVNTSITVSWTSTLADTVTINGTSSSINGSATLDANTVGNLIVDLVASNTVTGQSTTETLTCMVTL